MLVMDAPRHAARAPRRQIAPPPGVDSAALADGVLRGDRAPLARAITLVESNSPLHRPAAREVLRAVASRTGHAMRIGISGVPGAGKSTFIESFGNHLCDLGHRVAVLAVDPSSSLSGGSILGDKTRMEPLSRRPECFIRPSPSGGALGGVARKTRETISLCEAAGYDVVLIETVGVGQSEITVRSMVDCIILLLIAGAGDELQGMKKGILEIADIFVVNKADGGNRARAEATRAEFARIVPLLNSQATGWRPPVLSISAIEHRGISDLWDVTSRFFEHLREDGRLDALRRAQTLHWWRELVEQELHHRFVSNPAIAEFSRRLENEVLSGRTPPSLAAEELLDRFLPRL